MSGPRQKVEPETVAELVRLYNDGQTIERLARRYALTYQRARALLLGAGVALRPPKIQLPPTPPGMVKDYLGGWSIRQLAAKHGRSYNQTRRMLLAEGVQLRQRGAQPYEIATSAHLGSGR
ncbi:helix-turn-helix domain-containing protein [Amycolatopsis sp. lyj-84]|uniref:helix-turn-helix domain-containing protein n=1 Tax=Amycolatopsis sp. lyj-84 TaxID=2789284 RepID=UPI003979DF6C